MTELFDNMADDETIETVRNALMNNGIEVIVAGNGKEALEKLIDLIPEGSDVGEATSTTLDQIGATEHFQNSGKYNSTRKRLQGIENPEERADVRRHMISPEFGIGSVQAITEKGQVTIASATGSQLAPYVYGAKRVIWVAGTNKIVKSLDDAFKRIYEHCLPLESERVKKAYNMQKSVVNKILIFEKERQGRITLILVKEKLGF